jgi:hypothetical protein
LKAIIDECIPLDIWGCTQNKEKFLESNNLLKKFTKISGVDTFVKLRRYEEITVKETMRGISVISKLIT